MCGLEILSFPRHPHYIANNMKGLILILFLSASAHNLAAQHKGDTVLYLLFERGQLTYKGERSIYPMGVQMENTYAFHDSNLYYGYPLDFISVNRKEAKRIPIEDLGSYNVVTIGQLKDFISKNYRQAYVGYDGSDYFDGLKHIYLVEKDEEKGVATITEVRLDINIE